VTVIVPYVAGEYRLDGAPRAGACPKSLGSLRCQNRRASGTNRHRTGRKPRRRKASTSCSARLPDQLLPILQKLTYDPEKDFVPVSIFGDGPYISHQPSIPAKALPEFVDACKGHPGKLNYSSAHRRGRASVTRCSPRAAGST